MRKYLAGLLLRALGVPVESQIRWALGLDLMNIGGSSVWRIGTDYAAGVALGYGGYYQGSDFDDSEDKRVLLAGSLSVLKFDRSRGDVTSFGFVQLGGDLFDRQERLSGLQGRRPRQAISDRVLSPARG